MIRKELKVLPGGMVDEWDVSQVIDLSQKTLRRYRKLGLLPYSKVGKRIYYREEDVIKLLRGELSTTD